LILGLALGWGLNWPAMKIGLAEFPLWTFRASSCLVSGLSLLLIARITGSPMLPRPHEWSGMAVAALFNITAWQMFIAAGLRLTGSGEAAVVAFTMPLWAVFFAWLFLREPLGLRGAAALTLGIAGIVVLMTRDIAAIVRSPTGIALILAGAIGWAIGTMIQKRRRFTLNAMALAGWQLTIGAVPMLVMVPVFEPLRIPDVSATAWLMWAYTTFPALVFCYAAWFQVVKLMPVNVASISVLLVPAVGVLSGALILGEPLGLREITALLLIGAALALVLLLPPRRAEPPRNAA
jgi:drug/metabolite transporter (DMT)-like permease